MLMARRPLKALAIAILIINLVILTAFLPANNRQTILDHLNSAKIHVLGHDGEHVVERLVREAQSHFETVKKRQSQTLSAATKEYERRYKKKVPDGFAAWYAFAKENGVERIDEYDDLMKSLEIFRRIPSTVLKSFFDIVLKGPGLSKWNIKNGSVAGIRTSDFQLGFDNVLLGPESLVWHAREIQYLLDPILPLLPDMEILFNEWDEPRVLLDPDYDGSQMDFDKFQTKSYHNAYEDLIGIPCRNVNHRTATDVIDPFAPYLSDVPGSKEVCQHISVGQNYAMILNPYTLSVTRSLVPLLSMSKISTVADLTYPNALYIEGLLDGEYTDSEDTDWETKENDLYWAGRTSGGLASADSNWHEFHRHRLVATVNGLVDSNLSAEFQEHKELFNVRFTGTNQCNKEQCAAMAEYFSITDEPDPFNEVYRHRYLLDIDGNVFSRRFYSLMFSRSTVLKQTWQQEYFDEWLFPWVHYVPVSMEFEELPELMHFLATTERGQNISQNIASAGREWALKTFRAVEGSSYLFRLLLEYAELFQQK